MAASPQIQFRAIGILNQELNEREEAGFPASEIARRDLERYYILIRQSLPTFTIPEAMLLVDALNGHLAEGNTARLLWAEVADAIMYENLAEKWSVQTELTSRLREMTPFECMAVIDAVERVWNSETYHIDNMEDRIKKVGLVK